MKMMSAENKLYELYNLYNDIYELYNLYNESKVLIGGELVWSNAIFSKPFCKYFCSSLSKVYGTETAIILRIFEFTKVSQFID